MPRVERARDEPEQERRGHDEARALGEQHVQRRACRDQAEWTPVEGALRLGTRLARDRHGGREAEER